MAVAILSPRGFKFSRTGLRVALSSELALGPPSSADSPCPLPPSADGARPVAGLSKTGLRCGITALAPFPLVAAPLLAWPPVG